MISMNKFMIRIECTVNPSEDKEKVIKAIKNVISMDGSITTKDYDDYSILSVRLDGIERLRVIREQIHSRQVMNTFRRIMNENSDGRSTWLYLNKQAAYAGVVSVCESEDESPLGPIKITIEADDIDSLIEWLTE